MNENNALLDTNIPLRSELGQGLKRHEGHERNMRVHFARSMLRNILHSASQGLGIGAVLTYAEMLQMGSQRDKNRVQVDAGIYDALMENAAAGRQWLAAFENILSAFEKQYACENIGADTLSREFSAAVNAAEKFRGIKNQWLSMGPVTFSGRVRVSREGFREIMGELLLNAFKHSPPSSRIRILCCSTEKLVSFMIVNEVEMMRGGVSGVPPEYQKKVFEPFFRLNNTWDDRFRDQRFGLGIGLTLAENVANACGGQLYTYEIDLPVADTGKNAESAKRIVSELVLEKAG